MEHKTYGRLTVPVFILITSTVQASLLYCVAAVTLNVSLTWVVMLHLLQSLIGCILSGWH